MKERLLKLMEVKSIVTLTLTVAATFGFVTGVVPVELFATWFGAVLTYFFNKDRKDS